MKTVEMSPGVLAVSQIKALFEDNSISPRESGPPDFGKMDGSAFDLPIGKRAWRLEQAGRPNNRELRRILDQSPTHKVDDDGHFLFEKGNIYLVELDYDLDLPSNINGRATGKSSVGRLDVITRLLTEGCREYDIIDSEYNGRLYMLVLPQTYSVKAHIGDSLNQLRLFSGPPTMSVITRQLIGSFGSPFWHTPDPDHPGQYEKWNTLVTKYSRSQTADPTLFDLTVELADPDWPFICKAISPCDRTIDLRRKGGYDPELFFRQEPIKIDGPASSVVLEQGAFYIMKSKERLYIPRDIAVEVIAISERIGDIRIHYAGFAHPGFGRHDNTGRPGTPLIFEVRATDMPTRLYDGSLLAQIRLFRMSAQTNQSASAYDRQELNLSSVFHDWSTGRK